MKRVLSIFACSLLCLCWFGSTAGASMSTWTDTQGTSFKGEPKGSYGPYALFKTGQGKGRRVLFRMLSPEDCVRFYKETEGKFLRASDWSKGKSSITFDLPGHVNVLQGDVLAPADLKGKPEPELYVVLFASSWEGPSYQLPERFRATYERLRRLYGNDMEAIFAGVRQDDKGDLTFAKGARVPWLVADYANRGDLEVCRNFAPENGNAMVLVSREGVPLALTEVNTVDGMRQFCDEVTAIMASADERNSLFWKDRAYYLANIRPVQFAEGSTPPLLVGNPLRPSILRKNQIKKLTAKIEIDAQGNVTAATITNRDELKPALASAFEKAFKNNFVFLPAVDHGKNVAASYDFEYTVPIETAAMEADRDWVFLTGRKDVSIASWLVLRPIPVPAEAFSGGAAKDSAFNTDFFTKDGANSLAPFGGQQTPVDGKTYTWERCEAKDGYVDLRGKAPADNSVGYAWTEIDVPAAGPAYLGFGSTDGARIWVNGNVVLDQFWMRMFQIDQDLIPIQLLAGKNTILVKTQNPKDDWSFVLRVRR